MNAFYAIDPVNGERVLCSARVNAEIREYMSTILSTFAVGETKAKRNSQGRQHQMDILKFIERGREDARVHREAYEGFLKWRNENKKQPIIVQASQITP
jgi:hypothetical protein